MSAPQRSWSSLRSGTVGDPVSPVSVLLRLVRFSPRYFALCVLYATLLYCWLPIPLGLATQAFFDGLAGQSTSLNVWTAIAVLVAVQLIEALAGPLLGNPWSPLQQKSQVLLRRNLFGAILRGYGEHGLPAAIGETISRFRDDPEHIADALDALCDLIGRACFALVAVVVMWRTSPPLTLVACLPLVLSALVTRALGERIMAYRNAARAATGQVTGFIGELLGARLAVTVASAVPHVVGHLVELGDTRRRLAVRDTVFGTLLDSLSLNLGHFGTGLVLLLGAQAIRDGTFSVGDFALFVVYLDQLSWLPEEIGRLLSDLTRIEVSIGRMMQLVPGEPPGGLVRPAPVYLDGRLPAVHPPPARERFECLEVDRLSYVHPSSGRGICDVSFRLERGSVTVITGRIGAGKTTLLQVILGLLPRTAGEIRWNGRPIDRPADFFVPPRSAMTPQLPHIFSQSLRDNLLLGLDAAMVEPAVVEDAIRAAVLEADIATLEHGLDTLVGPRGMKLSGGQVRRVAAARMFVQRAELVVLDDLSSALDAETAATLWQRLFARGPDLTCLVVSHHPAVLHRADQILHLADGRLVAPP
jgi:ATP-binding cassette, subfamily B, bacterial